MEIIGTDGTIDTRDAINITGPRFTIDDILFNPDVSYYMAWMNTLKED